MQIKKFLAAAALISGLGCGGAAQAGVLYSVAPDLSSSQFGNCIFNSTCGGPYFAGQEFTLSSNSVVDSIGFNTIITADSSIFGTSANYFIFSTTNNGAPATVLASGSNASLSHSVGPTGDVYGATVDYSFDITPLTLDAGNYVVAFQEITSNYNDYLSLGTASSGAFESDDSGLTYHAGYSAQDFDSVAITVNGTAATNVPEPSSVASFAAGLAGIGFLAYRRRKEIQL